MRKRHIAVMLAAGATLALASSAAQAQIVKGGGSHALASSSAASKHAAQQKITRQYLKWFHEVHGAGAVAPGGVGLFSWQTTRPYQPVVVVLPSGSSASNQITCSTDENGNGCTDQQTCEAWNDNCRSLPAAGTFADSAAAAPAAAETTAAAGT
jgi:hypothetical protein